MDSKELFNKIKNSQIRFSEAMNKQKDFLKKLNEVKMDKKNEEEKEVIENLNKFHTSREEVNHFFRDYIEILSDANYDAKKKKMKLREQDLKY